MFEDKEYIISLCSKHPNSNTLLIALSAYSGKKDKAGEDYRHHALKVKKECREKAQEPEISFLCNMYGFDEYDLGDIGLLHDVVEDSDYAFDDLLAAGIKKEIVDSLRVLTRKSGESYMNYIKRVGEDFAATIVKIEDLKDNMNLSRLPKITQADLDRNKKYKKALLYLQGIYDDTYSVNHTALEIWMLNNGFKEVNHVNPYCKVFKYEKGYDKSLITIPGDSRIEKYRETLYFELNKMIALLDKDELNSLKEALFKNKKRCKK